MTVSTGNHICRNSHIRWNVSKWMFVLGLVVFALVIPSAHADDEHGEDDDEQTAQDLERARELYREGNSHYAAGRYEKASRAFLRGYKLSHLPGFLYNLANAYERMGKYQEAADKLDQYLQSPKAKDVVSVRERVHRLRAAAAERRRELRRQRALEARQQRTKRRQQDVSGNTRNPSTKKHLYWFAGGGVSLASTVIFGGLSEISATKAQAGCSSSGVCTREVEKHLKRERTFAAIADISLGVGVALVSTGVVVYFLNRSKGRGSRDREERLDDDDDDDDDDNEFAVVPTVLVDGVGLSLLGRF